MYSNFIPKISGFRCGWHKEICILVQLLQEISTLYKPAIKTSIFSRGYQIVHPLRQRKAKNRFVIRYCDESKIKYLKQFIMGNFFGHSSVELNISFVILCNETMNCYAKSIERLTHGRWHAESWRKAGHGIRLYFARLESGRGLIDQTLRLLLHPLLIVVSHIFLVLSSRAVSLAY